MWGKLGMYIRFVDAKLMKSYIFLHQTFQMGCQFRNKESEDSIHTSGVNCSVSQIPCISFAKYRTCSQDQLCEQTPAVHCTKRM